VSEKVNSNSSTGAENRRRTFFRICFAGMGVVATAAVLYPVAGFLQLPHRFASGESLIVPDGEILEGQALYREHNGKQVILIRLNGVVYVFNASCPHLGCLVTWDPVGRMFRCPCHGAAFDESGSAVHGPVNKPLTKMQYTEKNGNVVLS